MKLLRLKCLVAAYVLATLLSIPARANTVVVSGLSGNIATGGDAGEYVRDSQTWSGEKSYSDYSDQYIDQNFAKNIMDFPGPRGTLLIYNTYGIHRAKPVMRPDFVRKSLLIQVDAILDESEPLLINPEYITNPDQRLLRYLGFGLPCGWKVYPQTDLTTLPLARRIALARQMIEGISAKQQVEILCRSLTKKVVGKSSRMLLRSRRTSAVEVKQ